MIATPVSVLKDWPSMCEVMQESCKDLVAQMLKDNSGPCGCSCPEQHRKDKELSSMSRIFLLEWHRGLTKWLRMTHQCIKSLYILHLTVCTELFACNFTCECPSILTQTPEL